jgi:hypothetical protein
LELSKLSNILPGCLLVPLSPRVLVRSLLQFFSSALISGRGGEGGETEAAKAASGGVKASEREEKRGEVVAAAWWGGGGGDGSRWRGGLEVVEKEEIT